MNNIMLDLETLGTKTETAPIVSIGAVRFDLNTGELGDEFYQNVDLQDCLYYGFKIDPNTLYWWLGQSEEASKALIHNRSDLVLSLERFTTFVADIKGSLVWGNGVLFDNAILRKAYNTVKLKVPWHFRADRDVRTLVALGKSVGISKKASDTPMVPNLIKHNALSDAKYQAAYVCEIWRRIRYA